MTARKRCDGFKEGRTESRWFAVSPASGASVRPRILLAEDDPEMRALLAWSLRREHYEVTECIDGLDLVSKLGTYILFGKPAGFDVVISDIRLPGVTALEIFDAMRECEELPPVILITGFGDDRTKDEAKRLGVAALFDKPFEIDDLLAKTRELLDSGRTRIPRGRAKESSLAARIQRPCDETTPCSDPVSPGKGEFNEEGKP